MLYPPRSFMLLATILMMVWSCKAHGQRSQLPDPETAVETAAAIDRYQKSIDQYLDAVNNTPNQVEAYLHLDRAYRMLGQYSEAETQIRKAIGIDGKAVAPHRALGELLMLQGKYEEAEAAFQQALSQPDNRDGNSAMSRLQLGRLYLETGRKTEAQTLFQTLLQNQTRNADEILAAGLAAKHLEQFHLANNQLDNASRVDPGHIDAYIERGNLFIEKYQLSDGTAIIEDALKIDPTYPPALIGLAKALIETRTAQAEAKCLQALTINPNLIEARQLLARMYLDDEQYASAVEQLELALAVNPNSPMTRSLLAACYNAMGKQDEYLAEQDRVLKINPNYGQLYATVADNLSRRYRFREAIEMGRKAIKMDPELWSAYASLGVNLSRVGEEKEAQEHLELAFSKDSFNLYTLNSLRLFEDFENYAVLNSQHFVLKLHKEENPVYGTLALELLEQAHSSISTRYGFKPEKPILVELFPEHDDFAVRISGLPGAGALLGVCFGEVVVADSPRARPVGSFNWGQTLWHEYAHVVHLQLTRNRIPRWLAEGIAVYEARIARPEWDIDLEIEFAAAVEKDELLKVSDLNSGFTRPKSAEQVILSYYQASIVVDYIVDLYGFDAIRTMLRHYNDDRDTDDVIQETFEMSFDAFDEAFLAYVKEKTAPTRKALKFSQMENRKELTVEDLRSEAALHPESFYAHLFLGRKLIREGKDEEAIEPLTRAQAILPGYVHADNPYRLLAGIYKKQGDTQAHTQILEALTAIDEDNIEALKELAEIYARGRQDENLIQVLSRATMINPFDSKVRNMRGAAFERLAQYDRSITEFKAALAVETTDMAQAHYNLARVFLQAGMKSEAKRSALFSLEIAPNFEAAQNILLKSME